MVVKINDKSFSYDVHSLVKAFYPTEDVAIETFSRDAMEGIYEHNNSNSENDSDATSVGDVFECIINGVQIIVHQMDYNRSDFKNSIKRKIYGVLSKETGMELPWGTLTGIRPTKIPMALLIEGKTDVEISDYIRNTYLVSEEKTNLAIDIAKRELKILNNIHADNGYSLYIGIPFCPTTCLYCSFTSYPIAKWRNSVNEYISCLKKEIDYVSENFKDKICDSVYIGGGTPTTLEPEQFDDLISYVREKIDLSNCLEFTVEAGRPDSITEDKLIALKRNGVTRISVNPQTMNDDTLKLIGRSHSVNQFIDAFNIARKYFDNINTDLIIGLPGEDIEKVTYTFEEISKLRPDSITVHSMAIKRAAHMDEYLKAHPEIKSENSPEMMDIARECSDKLSMAPYYLYRQKNMSGNYENTGYSLPGKEGIYNILIMEEVQSIVALGAGTVTKRVYGDGRIERCDNVKDVKLYIEKIDEMIDRKRQLFMDGQ